MKLSKVLLLLAIEAKGDDSSDGKTVSEPFVASDVTEICSEQIPDLGGIYAHFDTSYLHSPNAGRIEIWHYPANVNCKQVVEAISSCEEIKVTLQSVAVQGSTDCRADSFRFAWGETITPPRCHCVTGCGYSLEDNDYDSYYFADEHEGAIGPLSYVIDSNQFTLYFQSNDDVSKGHLIFAWECTDLGERTTIVPATNGWSTTWSTTLATTASTTTTSNPTCSEHYDNFEEFGNRIRNAIEQALSNDIQSFSTDPESLTSAAKKRAAQFNSETIEERRISVTAQDLECST